MRVPHARCAGTSNVFKIAARYMDLYEHRRNVCALRSHARPYGAAHTFPRFRTYLVKKKDINCINPLSHDGRQ